MYTHFISFILFLPIFCIGQTNYTYTSPPKLQDGWETNTLKKLSIDSSLIYKCFNQLKNNPHKIHSVLLIKDQELIVEEYFGKHSPNLPHDLRSTSKSIRSILIGIAIDKGYIESIDDPIFKYLKTIKPKKNLDPKKEIITIRHLLTMSSGLECNDWDKKSKGQEDRVYKKKDWIQYTLDLPMLNNPGDSSYYCSMGVVLLVEIISQASGMSIQNFAQKHLFDALGISNVTWGHTSNKKVIASAKRLYMTSRDMAKIGLLILNKGKWKDKQIVSSEWIEKATSPKTKITGIDYGFLWWNLPFKHKEKKINSIVATGNGGQYIIVLPELNMIAIFTGGAYNSMEDKLPFAIVQDIFIPSLLK